MLGRQSRTDRAVLPDSRRTGSRGSSNRLSDRSSRFASFRRLGHRRLSPYVSGAPQGEGRNHPPLWKTDVVALPSVRLALDEGDVIGFGRARDNDGERAARFLDRLPVRPPVGVAGEDLGRAAQRIWHAEAMQHFFVRVPYLGPEASPLR